MQIHLTSSPHQRQHREAVEAGLKRLGSPSIPNAAVCWGWRGGKLLRARGKNVVVLERGYIGDRFRQTSIGINGLNNRAEFPGAPHDDGRRFRSIGVPLNDWSRTGDYVLLIGQVQGDMSLQGRDLSKWYAQKAKEAAEFYGLPVMFRPHPMEARRGIRRRVAGATVHTGTLDESIAGARVVVTFNSNTGVESILAGKETVVFDSGSMAYPVAAHDFQAQCVEDREQWAHDLAWKQWSLDEISSGEALAGIVEKLRGL